LGCVGHEDNKRLVKTPEKAVFSFLKLSSFGGISPAPENAQFHRS